MGKEILHERCESMLSPATLTRSQLAVLRAASRGEQKCVTKAALVLREHGYVSVTEVSETGLTCTVKITEKGRNFLAN